MYFLLQVAFSGIPPRLFNCHKPWLPTAQQACHPQHTNDVALTVNKTLMKLVTMILNLHYIGHPQFGHADIKKYENSPEHFLLARHGLHLGYQVCKIVYKDIIDAASVICQQASRPAPS